MADNSEKLNYLQLLRSFSSFETYWLLVTTEVKYCVISTNGSDFSLFSIVARSASVTVNKYSDTAPINNNSQH